MYGAFYVFSYPVIFAVTEMMRRPKSPGNLVTLVDDSALA